MRPPPPTESPAERELAEALKDWPDREVEAFADRPPYRNVPRYVSLAARVGYERELARRAENNEK